MTGRPSIDLHDSVLDHVQTDVVRLHPEQTVGHALEALRARAAALEIVYVYVVDGGGRLLGVVPTRALLAEYFVTQRFLAFPVVSADGVLVGQVDVSVFTDEVVGHAKRSFDDIFQIIGVHATQGRTVWLGFLGRFPWLLTNMAGGMLCALLASQYEALLDAAVVLALFVPMVLALAESVSMQSVTLTL